MRGGGDKVKTKEGAAPRKRHKEHMNPTSSATNSARGEVALHGEGEGKITLELINGEGRESVGQFVAGMVGFIR